MTAYFIPHSPPLTDGLSLMDPSEHDFMPRFQHHQQPHHFHTAAASSSNSNEADLGSLHRMHGHHPDAHPVYLPASMLVGSLSPLDNPFPSPTAISTMAAGGGARGSNGSGAGSNTNGNGNGFTLQQPDSASLSTVSFHDLQQQQLQLQQHQHIHGNGVGLASASQPFHPHHHHHLGSHIDMAHHTQVDPAAFQQTFPFQEHHEDTLSLSNPYSLAAMAAIDNLPHTLDHSMSNGNTGSTSASASTSLPPPSSKAKSSKKDGTTTKKRKSTGGSNSMTAATASNSAPEYTNTGTTKRTAAKQAKTDAAAAASASSYIPRASTSSAASNHYYTSNSIPVGHHSHDHSIADGGSSAAGDSPLDYGADQPPPYEGTHDAEPLFVNAKQYHRIIKRRTARARLQELHRLSTSRKVSLVPMPYYPIRTITLTHLPNHSHISTKAGINMQCGAREDQAEGSYSYQRRGQQC